MFEIGKEYSREDIHRITGGSKQAFLPVKGGKVVAARLRQDLNPRAPDVIVCDGSASARGGAHAGAADGAGSDFPANRASDRFRYAGDYVVAASLTVPADYAEYVKNSSFTLAQISRVIKMRRC
nr:hypothetical protein [Burkholderia gladioli]